MKKAIILIMALCLAFSSSFGVGAATAETTKPLTAVDCRKGSTLSVQILANIGDISGLHLTFKYDKTKLRYKGETTKIGHGNAIDNSDTLEWSTMFSPEGQALKYSDIIAQLDFEVLGDVGKNDKYIEYDVVEAYDNDMKDIDFEKCGAFKFITGGTSDMCGDFDGDNVITTADALGILRLSMNNNKPSDSSLMKICDVVEDGVIEAADALDVLRYSAELPTTSKLIGTSFASDSSTTIYLNKQ